MIIAISGSVGVGKTTIAKELSKKLSFEIIHLNDWAKEFMIEEVKELQTFDFNVEGLIHKVNQYISNNLSKNIIFEGHFAHFINPELVDFLFVITRNLKELGAEYEKREYNEQKIKDNLEVESFNLCFYEGIEEGYEEEKQIFVIENSKSLEKILVEIEYLIKR
ncbi:MAG: AAA family ATPase [Candidatus Woesearchaeota archaeon]|jgi:adenylate kinase|nr:AAA family ATPase [Candidatus Woesearchaeota archaeon]